MLVASKADSQIEMGARLKDARLLRKGSHGNSPKWSPYENSGSQTAKAARK